MDSGKIVQGVLAFIVIVGTAGTFALLVYRITGGNPLDTWIWLFTGKEPGRKPKNSPAKQTTPKSQPDRP